MDDLFYKKGNEMDRNLASGAEEDLWDEPETVVSEVKKTNKKVPKHNESDFEQEKEAD